MFMASKALKQASPDSDIQISEEHFREKLKSRAPPSGSPS
jgi:hypothetical protein